MGPRTTSACCSTGRHGPARRFPTRSAKGKALTRTHGAGVVRRQPTVVESLARCRSSRATKRPRRGAGGDRATRARPRLRRPGAGRRGELDLGEIVPVGDLFDALAEGDEPFTESARHHFENARNLYRRKLLPLIESRPEPGGDDESAVRALVLGSSTRRRPPRPSTGSCTTQRRCRLRAAASGWRPRSGIRRRQPGRREAVDDADPGCRTISMTVCSPPSRRVAPLPVRRADGLDAGRAHGPRRSCRTTAWKRSDRRAQADVLTEAWGDALTWPRGSFVSARKSAGCGRSWPRRAGRVGREETRHADPVNTAVHCRPAGRAGRSGGPAVSLRRLIASGSRLRGMTGYISAALVALTIIGVGAAV